MVEFKPRHEMLKIEPNIAVLVVSNSRFRMLLENGRVEDESGNLAVRLLKEKYSKVRGPIYVPNDVEIVRGYVKALPRDFSINTILTIGGTGPSRRDKTIDAVSEIGKELPGFGEFFRRLSESRIGPHAILSRAGAYVCENCIVFCLPGSPDAVELAIRELIIPTLGHILSEIFR
ncbi:MAG: molybdenum cofactor biosynthesis protein MoaB [Crenarchaeota archaeon]|nr:molybdenum cofactor biosynthesis protein MoaB [Thermoproteota archaeon]